MDIKGTSFLRILIMICWCSYLSCHITGCQSTKSDESDTIEEFGQMNPIEEPMLEKNHSEAISEIGNEDPEDFTLSKNHESFDPSGIIVHFEFDDATLTDKTKSYLDKIVQGMKKDPLARILVRGHADKQGPKSYNSNLSAKRAQMIRNYLISNGINEDRFITVNLGESEPIIDQNTVRAYRKNRRGDFYLDYSHNVFSSE